MQCALRKLGTCPFESHSLQIEVSKILLFVRDLSCNSTQERETDNKNEAITTIIYEWSFHYSFTPRYHVQFLVTFYLSM